MVEILDEFGNGKEIFIGICSAKNEVVDQEFVKSKSNQFSALSRAGGVKGELLPYRNIYDQWTEERISEKAFPFYCIDILYVSLRGGQNNNNIYADILFSLRNDRFTIEASKKLFRLIKEGYIDICFRSDLSTFDLFLINCNNDSDFSVDTKKDLMECKSYGSIIDYYINPDNSLLDSLTCGKIEGIIQNY